MYIKSCICIFIYHTHICTHIMYTCIRNYVIERRKCVCAGVCAGVCVCVYVCMCVCVCVCVCVHVCVCM